MSSKRVYHPTADAFKDVPEADVDKWADAGWRKTKPKHVDESEALPVGSYAPPAVAVDVTEPAPVKTKTSEPKRSE